MRIVENYVEYAPPRWIKDAVERLLASLPPGYLSGLEAIVLTNSATQTKAKISRVGRRKRNAEGCGGFYSPSWHDRAPSITIMVDNVTGRRRNKAMYFHIFQDSLIGGVLYHEIGHHLDVTIGAPARTGEAAADEWGHRLMQAHLVKTYARTIRVATTVGRVFLPLIMRYAKGFANPKRPAEPLKRKSARAGRSRKPR